MKDFLLWISLAIFASQAQGKELDWERAKALALAHNPDLKILHHQEELAALELKSAARAYGPSLNAFASHTRNHLLEPDVAHPENDAAQLGLRLEQPLFEGFATSAQHSIAENRLKAAQARVIAKRAEILSLLKIAYVELNYQKKARVLTAEIVRRRKDNQRLVQLRYDSGLENKGSLGLTETQVMSAELELAETEGAEVVAQQSLSRILGQPLAPVESLTDLPVKKPLAAADLDQIAKDHPDQQAAAYDAQGARWGITAARSRFYPRLDLSAQYQANDKHFLPKATQAWSMTFGITIPLFQSGRDLVETEAASVRSLSANVALEQTRQDLALNLRQSLMAWQNAYARLGLSQKFLDTAQLRSDISRTRYRNGLLTFDDWVSIENDLISNMRAKIEAERNVLSREAEWERAQGKG